MLKENSEELKEVIDPWNCSSWSELLSEYSRSTEWQDISVVVVQSLSLVFATPWTAASQASLCFSISWSLLRLMSIESVMPSSHLILCHPLLLLPSIFSSIRVFPMSWIFASHGQSIGASASVLTVNIQVWFPLGLTGLISLQSFS